MRRPLARQAALPAAALCLWLSGCGGSGGDEEVPVVDLRDPSFGGAPAAPPAPAAPAAPAAPGGAGGPVAGAPAGFNPAAGRGDPAGGAEAGAPSGMLVGAGPAGAAAPGGASPIAAARPAAEGGGAAASSPLNEMLSAANAANDPSASRGRSDAQAGDAGGAAPGGPGMGMPGGPGNEGMSAMMAMMGAQGAPGGPGGPGAPPMDPRMGMMGNPGGPGGPGDFGGLEGGMVGGPGFDQFPGAGGAGSGEPADFSNPRGAVDAFLNAVKAKDIQLLNDATALRAPREAETAARRKAFQAIREMSLTDEELDEIAESFDEFQVAQMSRPTSVGIVSFILRKQGDYGSMLQRKIFVRRERDGWKVNDVSGISELKRIGGRAMEERRKNQGGGTRP